MTRAEFAQHMGRLMGLHKSLSPEVLEDYWDSLQAFTTAELEHAFKYSIANDRWMPKPVDLRGYAMSYRKRCNKAGPAHEPTDEQRAEYQLNARKLGDHVRKAEGWDKVGTVLERVLPKKGVKI